MKKILFSENLSLNKNFIRIKLKVKAKLYKLLNCQKPSSISLVNYIRDLDKKRLFPIQLAENIPLNLANYSFKLVSNDFENRHRIVFYRGIFDDKNIISITLTLTSTSIE